MDDEITESLEAEREWLCRLLAEAKAGKRGMGDTLGLEGCQQLAGSIQTTIDGIDNALKIIRAAR